MGTKVSAMTTAQSITVDDLVYVVASGASRKMTAAAFRNSQRWSTIPTSRYTAAPSSTSVLLMSDTTGFAAGQAVRYTIGGSTLYGLVTTVTTDTSITVSGAPLSGTLTALQRGEADAVIIESFIIGAPSTGVFDGGAAADLLDTVLGQAFAWRRGPARLVTFYVKEKTADTGAEPKINVKVGSNLVSNADSSNGVQLTTSWQNNAVAVNTTNYVVAFGDPIEVRMTVDGGSNDSTWLSVQLVFVLV